MSATQHCHRRTWHWLLHGCCRSEPIKRPALDRDADRTNARRPTPTVWKRACEPSESSCARPRPSITSPDWRVRSPRSRFGGTSNISFREELATANAKIKRAESDLKRAEDRLDRRRNNSYKGFPPLPATTDELGVKKARFALEQALSEKKVLAEFTKGRKTRELKAEVDKARAVKRAKQRAWEIEKSKQSAIEHQIAQWQAVIVQRGEVKRSPSRSVGDTFSDDA